MIIDRNPSKAVFDALITGKACQQMTFDAAVSGGLAFLQAELEKRDPKVREPLTSVTWMRDIVCKSGGGWVDFTSTFHVDYATSGPNMYGIMGGETTSVPIMQADIGKDIYPVFGWSNLLKVPFVDMQKLQQVGRSLDDMLDKGIRLNWNKALDLIVYQGYGGNPGLMNNTSVTAIALPAGASSSIRWINKTPNEILNDVNTMLVNTWAASQYDVSGLANHILIPPTDFAYISTTIIGSAGSCSILTYLLENNIGKTQGVDISIFPSRWCIGAGQGGVDRAVAYVNDEDRLYFDLTVPIQRAMTAPEVKEVAYLTLYVGQIGVPKPLFLQCIGYFDGL